MADTITLPGTASVVATDDIGGVHYQRIKPTWGVDGTATDVAATTPLPTSTNASVFRFSTNNSSSLELAASATFTGVIETALDQPSISLLLTSDQPITLRVRQFIDAGGVSAVPDITYTIAAGQAFSASFTLNGNYVQVTAQNTGTATTTTFELNTAYGTLPSSDSNGRLPVSAADSVPLLTQTLTVAGSSTTMDTTGYQAVVVQISGVWQGNGTFDSSNDGVTWDTVLVLSRDNVTLLDIVTSGGLYTVRPSGRYLRFTLTSIVGSLALNAIGRASAGIGGADMLSLAMDKQHNAPLFTELNEASLARLAQANSLQVFTVVITANTPTNTVIFPATDISALRSVQWQSTSGFGAGQYTLQTSMDLLNWNTLNGANGAGGGQSLNTLNTIQGPARAPLIGRFLRVLLSSGTGAGTPATLTIAFSNTPVEFNTVSVQGTPVVLLGAGTNAVGDVGIQYRATATGAATTARFMAAATTNGALILTGARRLLGWSLSNTTASAKFFKIYNKATAPTVGTDTPLITISVPANGTVTYSLEGGIAIALGLGVGCTGLVADTDVTATAANDVVGALFYA